MKHFESFWLDGANECLWHHEKQIALPPKPFAVLRYLVENSGRLISHDELLDKLWPDTFVQPQVLRTYVLDLRKALGDDAERPRFIQTLPKRGYCFVAAVVDEAVPGNTGPGNAGPGDAGLRNAPHGKGAANSSVARRAACHGKSWSASESIAGRERELARLHAELEAATGGQRRLVLIAGETGIGKTALVDAFCRETELGDGAMVARGQCVQGFGSKEEYYPVMEALSQLCASEHGELACGVLSRVAPAWLAHGRMAGTASLPAVPAGGEERMLVDLCEALEELSAERTLVLVFEELEWVDAGTLNLVSALARRRANARLLIVGTFRARQAEALKGLKQDLLMRRLCTEMTLAPLAKAAVRELLAKELGPDTLPAGLDGFVYRRSEGNPLFAIAVLEHLIAEGVLLRKSADGPVRWREGALLEEMEAEVPGELAQMMELEVERLSPEERQVLEAGSLMPVAFPTWAVAAALGKDAGEVEETCDALARRLHFVVRAGEDLLPDGSRAAFYVFSHGLYREVMYQRQPASRRARRHVRVADRLGALFAGRTADVAREMAKHYEAGGDWLQAIVTLRTAAERARQRQAPGDADDLLRHALCLADNLIGHERAVVIDEIGHELATGEDLDSRRARPTGSRLDGVNAGEVAVQKA
jgi:DNA-binding winged helix-turn-helix (wHTH) protein